MDDMVRVPATLMLTSDVSCGTEVPLNETAACYEIPRGAYDNVVADTKMQTLLQVIRGLEEYHYHAAACIVTAMLYDLETKVRSNNGSRKR